MSDLGSARTGDVIELQPATRRALGLAGWLPCTRGNVAAHAWRLAYGEPEATAIGMGHPGMDTSTDLVVGTVEATEEALIETLRAHGPDQLDYGAIATEVSSWVSDFLADHASPADPSGQAATCKEFGIVDPTGPHARTLIFEVSSDIAKAVVDGMRAALVDGE